MKRKLPDSAEKWFTEILLALDDARDTKPFAPVAGTILTERTLFQLAPHVAIKFRGLKANEEQRDRVVKTALANYVVFTEPGNPRYVPGLKRNAKLAFALCYVAAHGALDLLTEDDVAAIMMLCDDRFTAGSRR
jgi:hypothetical protein